MTISKYVPGARSIRFGVPSLVALFSAGLLVALVGGAQAASTAVPLGTADSFAVLAGAGITNTGATTVNGDLGTYPTTTITGTSTLTVNGTNHGGDATTQQAKTDLVTAYNDAAGQAQTSAISADLGGQTLAPGVYRTNGAPDSIGLTGTLTLDAGGNPNAVFVFQAASTLTTATASSVSLTNGAQACNVFWQVGSSATLGTNSSFTGTIIALTSITANTGATVKGRLLARNGAVTMDTNTITKTSCSTSTSTSTPPPSSASYEVYCDPITGQTYDLVKGQDKVAPYANLNLVLAHVDATTGAKSCAFVQAEKEAAAAAKAAAVAAAKAEAAAVAANVAAAKAEAAKAVKAAKAARIAAAKAQTAKAAKAAKIAATKAAVARAAAAKAAASARIATARAAAARGHAKPARHHVGFTG